jgi:hypothetical protein
MMWLDHLICRSAYELEASRKTIFQFGLSVAKALQKNPIQEWEADQWVRGLKNGMIRLEGHFFRVGAGRRSALCFFIRNEQDLYVGLRRESITQAATYVTLVTDYGYSRRQTCFESRWMDVAIYGEDGKALIYAENKANPKTLEKLCHRLSTEFQTEVPVLDIDDERTGTRADDTLMKASHIWRHKPRYFWGVCPTHRQAYDIRYQSSGFRLLPVESIPALSFPIPQ